jgi:hypothetical protein
MKVVVTTGRLAPNLLLIHHRIHLFSVSLVLYYCQIPEATESELEVLVIWYPVI